MCQLASGYALSLHSKMYKGLASLMVSLLHRDSERCPKAPMTDVLELESHSCVHPPLTWGPPCVEPWAKTVGVKVDRTSFLAACCLVRGGQIVTPGLLNHDPFSHFKFFLIFFNFYYVVKLQTYRDGEIIQWIPIHCVWIHQFLTFCHICFSFLFFAKSFQSERYQKISVFTSCIFLCNISIIYQT